MTHHLMDRPIPRGVGSLSSGPALAGFTAALIGLATTAAPVLVLWVLSPYPQDTAGDAGKLVGGVWLLAHGGPLTRGTAEAPLSLTPLLATVLMVVLVYRAGARVVRRTGARTGGVPAAVCAGYLAVALPVALECSMAAAALRARVLPDLLAVAVLTYLAAAAGAGSFTVPHWWPAQSARLRAWSERWAGPLPDGAELGAAVRRSATGGLLALLAGSALLLALAVLLGSDGTDPVVRALTGGSISGAAGLLLTCLLLVPNAVVWCASYALGAGFLLGTGTMVAPGRVVLGAVPDFPLFALVPDAGAGWQYAVFVIPVVAGAACAGLLGRAAAGCAARTEEASEEAGPQSSAPWELGATALAAIGTALAAGLLVALAAWLAGGALGAGRMATLGPTPWWAGVLATGWFAVLTVPGALGVRWWLLRPERGHWQEPWRERWSGRAGGWWRAVRDAPALLRRRHGDDGEGEGGEEN